MYGVTVVTGRYVLFVHDKMIFEKSYVIEILGSGACVMAPNRVFAKVQIMMITRFLCGRSKHLLHLCFYINFIFSFVDGKSIKKYCPW